MTLMKLLLDLIPIISTEIQLTLRRQDKMSMMYIPFFNKKYKTILFFFLLANVIALFNFLVVVSSMLAEGENPPYLKHVIYEWTGAYSFCLLVPLMLFLFFRFPISKKNYWYAIPIYFLSAGLIGVVHTFVMYTSRVTIFDFAGWGSYEYGYLPYRIIMETLKMLLGFWILYGVCVLMKINRERQIEKLRAVELEEELTRNQLKILQAQINPHFLFNTLNMISSTMYDDVQSADKMIANLSDLLRISLKNNPDGKISLHKEIEILNLYLEIMKERFREKLEINFDIDESAKSVLVPSFLLQPIVENSIKHGMETPGNLKIEITTTMKEEKLTITIKDNGPGIHHEPEIVFGKGVGLANTQERLEKLYDGKFEFYWQNLKENGLLVTIILPVIN